ncbi:SAM-dependent methyltransferase [Stella sp.]|uniref:SAM-dependent methyltransferase n=1 Tax=Stella sp. TaxID=2912054 RepID=UPI0035B21704
MTDATPFGQTIYVPADGFLPQLLTELGEGTSLLGDLVAAPGPARPAAWARNVWHDPVLHPIASIGDAARRLRAVQRNWHLHAIGHFRRAELIRAKLPPVAARPLVFPDLPPSAPLGSWTLLDPGTMLAAGRCSSPVPDGEWCFVEDREAPPSRAYLKLWEALTRLGTRPVPGERCVDLGASPGGWTWVIQRLGARVTAVDKAPLAPSVAALPGVDWLGASAFSLDPAAFGPVDWLFSDVICYPARLLALVRRWMAAGAARNFVCTIKFQGETDHETAAAFAAIPGSRLMHLTQNKHELTWALVEAG